MISPTLIEDLRSTTKPKSKQILLVESSCEFLEYLLKATYEPFEVYHLKIDSSDLPEAGKWDINFPEAQTLIKEVVAFCKESNSSKKNRDYVLSSMSLLDKGAQEILLGVLSKNWKAGISSKTVEELFPGTISEFEVQLANSYVKVIKKKSYKPKSRWCSHKLDGVRCVFIRLSPEVWIAFSRQGKEFLTVDHLKPQLEELWKKTQITWWDGELYVPGLPFEEIQGMVMRFTKGTSFDLEYRVFMCGDKDAFLKKQYSKENFSIVEPIHVDQLVAPKIVMEPQWLIEEEQIQIELEKAFELGLEGIMLRDPDLLYDFKRSDALLKLKESETDKTQEKIDDALVQDIVIDAFYVIDAGAVIYKQLLTKLIVLQENGETCKVGSGFSLEFREYYTKNPGEIIGKVVEVKNQGLGSKGKMRFPRLFRVREDLDWKK